VGIHSQIVVLYACCLTWMGCASRETPRATPPVEAVERQPASLDRSNALEEVELRIPPVVCFGLANPELYPEARAVLDEIGAQLQRRNDITRVRVLGSADISREGYFPDRPSWTRGIEDCQAFDAGIPQDERDPSELSDQLSLQRARNVVEYLVTEYRLPRTLFQVAIDTDYQCQMGCSAAPGAFFEITFLRPRRGGD